MKKAVIALVMLLVSVGILQAQTDTMYVMKAGVVINKQSIKLADVDSIIFYKPGVTIPTPTINLQTALIPAGTFTMGSPINELNRWSSEIQHQVMLSEFRITKYEITNEQFATFLNDKGIGENGLFAAGTYPTEVLIYTHSSGLIYNNARQWVTGGGTENKPVINVTWFGAFEFAKYAGGSLPTEAQWEYACRAGSTTTFNTGDFLSSLQATYNWQHPYNSAFDAKATIPWPAMPVGSFAPNAYGLYDMHGNVWECCADWFGAYPTSDQVNPTGASSGPYRVIRGGSWADYAESCRSANRINYYPYNYDYKTGFRVAFSPK